MSLSAASPGLQVTSSTLTLPGKLHDCQSHLSALFTSPAALPGVVTRPNPALRVEGAALRQGLLVPDAPTVEILSKKVGIPVNISET